MLVLSINIIKLSSLLAFRSLLLNAVCVLLVLLTDVFFKV